MHKVGLPPPEVGALSIVENGREEPVGIIATTWVGVTPFKAVDAELGRRATEEMPLVCERFRLVYP